jgi:hypothetical protein
LESEAAQRLYWSKVTNMMNKNLQKQLSSEEIFTVWKELPSGRAPSQDSFPIEFYLKMWDFINKDLMEAFHEARLTCTLHRNLNTRLMCLLPKGGCKTNLKNWRPTTLLGTFYKILAKTMVRWVQPILNEIIRPNQIGFMKGRNTINNVFLAYEMMDRALESSHDMVFLLLDFEKAYDRIKWDFLEGTMATIGFGAQWITVAIGQLRF